MPKLMDTNSTLIAYRKSMASGDNTPRQVCCRIPLHVAVELLTDSLTKGKQPGPVLSEIVTDYYTTWADGVHLKLAAPERRLLDQIKEILDLPAREEVVKRLVERYASEFLSDIMTRQQSAESLINSGGKISK